MRFKKGMSGNPAGKPKGTKDKRTLFRELVEHRKEELVEKSIQLALDGNEAMLKLLLDRVLPPRPRELPLQLNDSIEGTLTQRGEKILNLIVKGQLTTSEGNALLQALSVQLRILERDELITRINKLEEITNANK